MSDFGPSIRRQLSSSWNRSERQVTDVVKALEKLGPPKTIDLNSIEKPVCWCTCKKPLFTVDVKPVWTGHVHAINNVCKDCAGEAQKLSTLVCAACKIVVARVAPHTDQMGFRFEAGKFYHIDFCGACNIERSRTSPSLIIEQYLFHKQMGRKV